MPRQRLELGTHGDIRSYYQVDGIWHRRHQRLPAGTKPSAWRCVTQFRDFDGVKRQLERSGPSETKALAALRAHLAERAGTKRNINSGSKVADTVPLYLEQIKRHGSGTTYDRYKSRLDNHVIPAIGQLLLRECTVGRLQQVMLELDRQGLSANTRRGIRSVLSGLMQLAVEHDIIAHNPVRDMGDIKGETKRKPKAMAAEELSDFLAKLDADPLAVRADLPDLIRFLFGTGVRIGEALAVRWRDVNLADEPITIDGQVIPPMSVWVNGNIVDIHGRGLVRHDGKTAASNRIVGLPGYLYTLLLVRKPIGVYDDEPVFPSGTLGWRHPSNLQRSIRRMRLRIKCPEFTTHTGRKTVATVLDQAGQSARAIADQLGHANPSMTQNVYMGRGLANPAAAAALDRAHRAR
jgi:integrase